ncbi:MAG TPA: family 78 glycoside hydrolase catalytic domain, partial [Oceanipulchritudo sp.]|nr:family 78 glycoside hydrolase catalytic domain [Oceanipulchritudo sp.]
MSKKTSVGQLVCGFMMMALLWSSPLTGAFGSGSETVQAQASQGQPAKSYSLNQNSNMPTAKQPTGLMVDLITDPSAAVIRNRQPRFSWIVNDGSSNAHQVAYQVIVSSSLQNCHQSVGDLWDSGQPAPGTVWKAAPQSTHVIYRGADLKPDQTYYWKVRTWNGPDNISPWSIPQAFHTGELLAERPVDARALTTTTLEPVDLVQLDSGAYFIDFGKAAFGTIVLNVKTKMERTIEVHLGEVIGIPHRIDRNPGGSRRYQMIPLRIGPEQESYVIKIPPDPRNTLDFAIHMPEDLFEVYPFRYCEIHGLPGPLLPGDIQQLVVHYPFDESASHFTSSSKVLNDVWELCKYTMKATSFCGYYVDGDRERIPYEADAYINQLGHYCVDREYAMARRTHEHLIRFPTWPTEWILDSVLIAWNDYVYSGDPSSLEFHYKDLQAKALTALARKDGLISLEGMNDDIMASIHFDGASLKMYPNGLRNIVDWPQTERDNFDDRPMNAVVNAFHYRAVTLMEAIARALGKEADAKAYRERAAQIRKSFAKTFVD